MIKTYINGFSAICAQGKNRKEIEENLFNHPKQPTLIELELDNEPCLLNYFPAFSSLRLSLTELVHKIESQIIKTLFESGWKEEELVEIPIFLSSTSFAMAEREIHFFSIPKNELEMACYQQTFSLNEISEQLKKKWPTITIINVATSCTSSSNALLYAQRYIQSELVDRAIIVGFESFNSVTIEGFYSLGLSTSRFVPPFTQFSDGLILGEGIGCMAISREPNPNSPYQFILAGGGMACDTTNITTTEPDNVVKLIESTLDHLDILLEQIITIKAHATGSPTNDHVEQQVLSSCHAHLAKKIPIIFLKPYLGHTLGASGILECILLQICLESQQLPLVPDYDVKDGQNEQKNIELCNGYYLLNCLGFGGNNTILLLEVNKS